LTEPQKERIKQLYTARKGREQMETEIRELALASLANGVPMLQVAEALGVARTTLYRWMRNER